MRIVTRISYSCAAATRRATPRTDIPEPHNGLGAQTRACEPGPPTRVFSALGWDGAARGVGAPASDRAGVWGGAPRELDGQRSHTCSS